uniref:Uncharacterized protein n=1 Tax=Arundo donax TaxID=35708 RepID=A0A0A9FQ30_ARUDO
MNRECLDWLRAVRGAREKMA